MVVYDRKLYVFGGAGSYVSSIKVRNSYNDLHVFDTTTNRWLHEPDLENIPRKRMNHAAGLLGCVMLVHGGFSTEAKRALDEYSLFDIEQMKWVETRVYINGTEL